MSGLNDILKEATKDRPPLITRRPIPKAPVFPECKFNPMGGTVKSLRTDVPFHEAFMEAMAFAYVAAVDYENPELLEE